MDAVLLSWGKTEVIAFCVKYVYYIFRYGLLHFTSKVITFWVTEFITFCVQSHYISLGLLLHIASKVITPL